MAKRMNPPVLEPDGPSPALRGFSLRQIALVAFVVGVLLHACVLTAVFSGGDDGGNGGGGEGNTPSISSPATRPETSPTPTPLPDRTSCSQIQGTNYRSETERTWFLQNCTGSSLPLPTDRRFG